MLPQLSWRIATRAELLYTSRQNHSGTDVALQENLMVGPPSTRHAFGWHRSATGNHYVPVQVISRTRINYTRSGEGRLSLRGRSSEVIFPRARGRGHDSSLHEEMLTRFADSMETRPFPSAAKQFHEARGGHHKRVCSLVILPTFRLLRTVSLPSAVSQSHPPACRVRLVPVSKPTVQCCPWSNPA